MKKKKIQNIIRELNDISTKYNDNEIIIAIYIWIRYGTTTFNNYIDEAKLNKIFEEIKNYTTIFDEQLNYNIDKILNKD